MARHKTFDKDQALDAAINVFREHGYEGTSAAMLVQAMEIGRQSLYDTFGDKWQLYCSALKRYVASEAQAHVAALRSTARGIEGIQAMLDRVITNARQACLGVSSICEFGRSRPELSDIQDGAGHVIQSAIRQRVRDAQAQGDIAPELDPDEVAGFVMANIASIRIAARGGASADQLDALGRLLMRALQ